MTDTKETGLTKRLFLPTVFGLGTIALAFGGFGYWAVTAPIAGAAVASGTVGPENSRQRVQHLEGGVVSSIHVRDGETVKAGQRLIVLDDTKSKAQLEAQLILADSLKARQTRLETELVLYKERKTEGVLTFPIALLEGAEKRPSTKKLLQVELDRFDTRISSLNSSVSIYTQQMYGFGEEIKGLERELVAIENQLKILDEENELFKGLRKRGLELQSRVLTSQRSRAQSEQLKAERLSRIAKLRAEVLTTKLKSKDLWIARIDEVSNELATVAQELLSTNESIRAYQDTLSRTVVNSPVDGTLISLAVNTEGGVLAAGATVVEIVPSADALTIEARVMPNDIDVVAANQEASVTLLAYPQRNLPKIYGKVKTVSADALTDSNTGETYYLAKIEMTEEELKKLGDDAKLVPGMTVQVMIRTSSRTFFDYVLSPVIETAERAFKEQ